MSMKDMLRTAFGAKDQKAFDALVSTLDEEGGGGPAITVHNHMPEAGLEQDRRRSSDDEPPPWFKKHAEETDARFRAMHDALEGALQRWAAEEEDEPNHNQDRRRGRDARRGVHDRLDALHDAVASMLDWARDADARMGDRRRGDAEGEFSRENTNEDPEGSAGGKDRRRGRDGEVLEEGAEGDRQRDEEILGELEFEAPPGTGDRARRATDSAVLSDAFQDACARAEVLQPGIRLPAYDRAASPAKTLRAIHGLRCSALDLAWGHAATRGIIEAALGGPGRTLDTKKMRPSGVRTLFNAVAAATADANNARSRDGGGSALVGRPAVGRVQSLADLNRVNADRYHPAARRGA